MALTQIDRELVEHCLQRKPAAWRAFVERFGPLLTYVVKHTAETRSIEVSQADVDDLTADVLMAIIANDFRLLRHFRQKSSLATYLTVVARRVALHQLVDRQRKNPARFQSVNAQSNGQAGEFAFDNRDHLEHLISRLAPQEAQIVRAFHLDGKSYHEISTSLGIPENSIGPILTRARDQLRQADATTH